MSAALVPVSFEEAPPFALQLSRAQALPQVVPASRLAERPAPATVLTGIAELDVLTGGLPRGSLSEVCGPASSGRTSVLLALMASMTAQGEVCALVDASDSFDPESAASAGVDFRRLLWVRCSKSKSMADRRYSMANAAHCTATCRRPSTLDCLEQALKATDLLLQGGGFGLVVVDLGDVPPPAARRVPLTSWFRFRRAVENTQTVLIVIEQEPYAKACASAVWKLSAIRSQLSARLQPSTSSLQEGEPAHARIFAGLNITAEVLRSVSQRKKPVQPANAQWESKTAWAG